MNSGMSRDYERSGQTWDQFALDHNPLYAATVGLGTAIGNGAGAAVVDNDYRPLANLGGEFAGGLLVGKAMNRYGNYGVMIDDIGASGLGRSQAGSIGVRLGRVENEPNVTSATTNKLPQWLKDRFDAGNKFNRVNRGRYQYNEVEVVDSAGRKFRVDSYNANSVMAEGEIVSRKFSQLGDIRPRTGISYLQELSAKYPNGAMISDSPFNPVVLRGQPLRGDLILEVPVQRAPIPFAVLEYADRNGIIIRDVNGVSY